MDGNYQRTSTPESPDSPSLPLSPTFPLRLDHNSGTLTEPDPVQHQNAPFNIHNEPSSSYNEAGESRDVDDNSNSAQAHPSQSDVENNSQPTNTIRTNPPWRPVLGHIHDNPTLRHLQSEDSNPPIYQELNSLSSFSDAETKKWEITDEPPAKIGRTSTPKRSIDHDSETCPICLDSWGNSGDHRLVALKCGHLFGAQCVEKWLRTRTSKERSCPTCKRKATLKDIRYIYARNIVAADTSQITILQKQIVLLQSEKSRTELELQKCRIAHQACVLQLEVLRSTLLKCQAAVVQPPRRSWRFALEKNLEISKDGGCRVLTYNCRTYEFYVSQKSTNNLFPGYGIRKIDCADYKLGQFLHLHPKPIRDITYSQPRDLLLSVGLDSTARIVERGIPSATIQTGVPLWSCSWDYMRSNEFYVGGVGGVIHQYDVRNPGTYIQSFHTTGDLSPVVSLCSTEYGLLSCQLNSCWLWVADMRQWEPRSLPIDGPFMSLCYDIESQRALLSCRAGGNERSRLTLCKLKASVPSGEILFDTEQTFLGSSRSTVMSRSAYVRAQGSSWIAAHSESDASLYLHGVDGARTISLPAAEPALDVCSANMNSDTILAALSESRLRLYKAVSTNS